MTPPACNGAIEELRIYLTRGLTASFGSRKSLSHEDIRDFAQEAEQKILEKLDTFRGNCKFTTWAMKIAVNHVLGELRRKRWQNVSLDALEYPEHLFSPRRGHKFFEEPEKRALKHDLINQLNRTIREELTERQRRAVTARFLYGIPPSHIAREMNTTRGAVYKLLHDARKRLKAALEERGLEASDTQELFE
jgi:RNA polymerase sigma-70 factor (ECF subfamily)